MARALTETDKKPGNSNGKFALKTFGMRAGLGADVGGDGGDGGCGDAGREVGSLRRGWCGVQLRRPAFFRLYDQEPLFIIHSRCAWIAQKGVLLQEKGKKKCF